MEAASPPSARLAALPAVWKLAVEAVTVEEVMTVVETAHHSAARVAAWATTEAACLPATAWVV